jgi:hypothetical protein
MAEPGETVPIQAGQRGGRVLPDGSRVVPPPGGVAPGGGVAKPPMDPKKRNLMIAGGAVLIIVGVYFYKKYAGGAKAQAATDAASTGDTTESDDPNEQVPNNQFSDFDPWQQFGPGGTATTSTPAARKSPYEGEKIGDGYFTRGSNTPKGYFLLTPAKMKAYLAAGGPQFYEPKLNGKEVRMGKKDLAAGTPTYGQYKYLQGHKFKSTGEKLG